MANYLRYIRFFTISLFFVLYLFSDTNSVQAALQCQVENGGCTGGRVSLLRMSALTNAHAQFEGAGVYSEYLCCDDDAGIIVDRNCAAPSDIFLHLSAPTNAHVEKKSELNYFNNACISLNLGSLSCVYGNPSCAPGFECLASISGDTNAHIGDCNAYPEKVCCGITSYPSCGNVDGVCNTAGGCTPDIDTDCPDVCGDGIISGGEVCDISEDIGCSPATPQCLAGCGLCNAPACGLSDGYCATGCVPSTDSDCPAICGDGFKTGTEGCDILGDVGCNPLGPNPICSSNCKTCVCALANNLTFFGKPIVCTVQDLILFILSIAGRLALLILIISGILYIFAGSDPEAQNKAKRTFNYAIIGLVFVLISYAIIITINNLSV